VLKLQPISLIGSPVEIVRSFGGRPQYLQALHTLEKELYSSQR
jgi:type I restriction enzyme R subunit